MTSPNDARQIAFFPGSFDPFTRGHESIVQRALMMFSRVIVGIGINPDKQGMMTVAQRKQWIEAVFSNNSRVEVVSYDGLTVDAVRASGACCIVRGVRDANDFAYETKIADFNRNAAGIETIFLPALPTQADVSSSEFRQLLGKGADVSQLLPSNFPKHILDELFEEMSH